MKKIKLLTIALLLSVFAFSQDYYPLVQESNEWNVLRVILEGGNVWDTTYYTQTYKISGDTLISEQAYKKVFKSEEEIPINWEYEGAIREAEQKVWYFPYYGNGETKIYDFTLNVGDTIEFQYQSVMVVDSIAFHEIAGLTRRHIYFSYIDFSPYTELWIEGIGSNYGMLSSGGGGSIGAWTWLLCMSENGELIYMNPNYNSCFLISTGINKISSADFNIYPNPTNSMLLIECLSSIDTYSIKLIDLHGKVVRRFKKNQRKLDLSDINSGVYLLVLETEKGLIHRKVIVN